MSDRIVSIRGWLILLFTVTAIGGCGDIGKRSQNSSPGRADSADRRPDSQEISERDVLRIRKDVLRNRLWVLTSDEVRVYNTATTGKRLIRKIALPNWFVVGFHHVCMPDLALDRAGSAFISSNGQARLLRIDADRLDLKDYAISFHAREGPDIGFGALAFAADGTLFARTTPGGSLWEIDINKARAVMSNLNKKLPLDECAITTQSITKQLLNDFERS
jgi:hypothetical protein